MKTLRVELSQVGKDVITQSSISIRVNGKFVKNSLKDIIENCLEIQNKTVKIDFYMNTFNYVDVILTFKSGTESKFRVSNNIFSGRELSIDTNDINLSKKLQDALDTLKEDILKIEQYVDDNHKVCNNYFFEI